MPRRTIIWYLVGFMPNDTAHLCLINGASSDQHAELDTRNDTLALELFRRNTPIDLSGWHLHAVRVPEYSTTQHRLDREVTEIRRAFLRFLSHCGITDEAKQQELISAFSRTMVDLLQGRKPRDLVTLQ